MLAKEVLTIKEELKHLKTDILRKPNSNPTDVCLLYVRLNIQHLASALDKLKLEELLHCPVINYSLLRYTHATVLKVKILKLHLHTALTAPDQSSVVVRIWKTKTKGEDTLHLAPSSISPPSSPSSLDQPTSRLRVTTWNCRDLNTGEPYAHHLADTDSDIIVVTKHWLWPFESHRLSQVHPSFTAETVTDRRLDENSLLTRGCGGVGLMWRKTLCACPVTGITSDRICGLHVKLSCPELAELTILCVYLPCADSGLDVYCEHLVELERVISASQESGPVLIVGDFNAHLASLGGVRGHGSPNQQGFLLKQLLDHCELYVVSLSALSEGSSFTFWNSDSETMVDYIIASYDASCYIMSCLTHELSPLNCSDHLHTLCLITTLCLPTSTSPSLGPSPVTKINWDKAKNTGCLATYQEAV